MKITDEMVEAAQFANNIRYGLNDTEMRRALSAALAAAEQPVAVKPLEWEFGLPGSEACTAKGVGGTVYTVWEGPNESYWTPGHFLLKRTVPGQIDEAKSAAQTDYEACVRRDMIAAEQPVPGVKHLEWSGNEATSVAGFYRVQKLYDKWEPLRDGYYMLPRVHGIVKAFDTLDEAKAAAQHDFETRIRSALASPALPAPSQDSGDTDPSDTNGTENDG